MHTQRHRSYFLYVTFLFIFFTSSVLCQSPDSTELKAGLWSLQFGISNNFTLTTFQGSTIAVKYQLSEKNAIRGGVSLYGSTNDGTTSNSASYADSSIGTVPGKTSSSSTNISMTVQYLWYVDSSYPVHFYVGVGPSVTYYRNSDNSEYSVMHTSNNQGYWVHNTYSSKNDQKGIGAAGCVGVEWFASRWLSVHAHYNETIHYQWRSTSYARGYDESTYPGYIPTTYDESTSTKGWSFSNPNVSFGVDIYL